MFSLTPYRQRFDHLKYSFLALLWTAIDALLGICVPQISTRRYPKPTGRNGVKCPTEEWTDEDFLFALRYAEFLPEGQQHIQVMSATTVAKNGGTFPQAVSEALAMSLIFAQTDIPVPRVHRIINSALHKTPDNSHAGIIVMDFVPNAKRLSDVWPHLTYWQKFKVVLIMRSYLDQIRRVTYNHRGRPGPAGARVHAIGHQFDYVHGEPRRAFHSLADLETFFRRQEEYVRWIRSLGTTGREPPLIPLDASTLHPLVFTHNDLNMRNTLVDADGVLWIIDWEWAGFYPPSFEYVALRIAAQKFNAPADWCSAIKYMSKPDFWFEEYLKRVLLASR